MRVTVVHETVYRYEDPANYSVQYLRLSPRSSSRQKVLWWKLETPAPVRPWVDAFGNEAHVLVVDRPHSEIRVRARGEIDVDDNPSVVDDVGPQGTDIFLRSTPLTTVDDGLAAFVAEMKPAVANQARGLDTLMGALRDRIDYKSQVTHAATSAADAFARKAGVCQDHTHVFVACCRALDVPARYVSGYLASTQAGEHLASHAWAEAWVEGQGWRGFDVANRVTPGGRHVRLAVGLDYLDACPVRGFRRGGGDESMAIEVRVGSSDTASEGKPGAGNMAQQHQRARHRQQQQQQQQQQ